MSEETDKNWGALVATMVARIESEGVGSPTHEKAMTDALDSIDGVEEVSIEHGAIQRYLVTGPGLAATREPAARE